jgi:2-isopropylmalate synthase
MKHKLNKSPEEVYESIKEHVTYARKFTDNVEWSCEDGTRTDMDYMCKTVELAIKSGATTIIFLIQWVTQYHQNLQK